MKKMNTLLVVFLAGTSIAFAQKHEPVNPQKDKLEYEGYTIRLIPAPGGTYGYYIRKGKELIAYQSYNPFTLLPAGLSKKDDAYKVAKWQIKNLKTNSAAGTKNMPGKTLPAHAKLPPALQERLQKMPVTNGPSVNRHFPKSVAQELKIDIITGTKQ